MIIIHELRLNSRLIYNYRKQLQCHAHKFKENILLKRQMQSQTLRG